MKIILDARLILPHMTGIGRYLMGLINGFENVLEDEYVEVWAQDSLPSHHPLKSQKYKKIHLHWLKSDHKSIHQLWRFPQELSKSDAEILHVPHFNVPLVNTKKLIVTIHNLMYYTYPHFLGKWSGIKSRLIQSMTNYAVQNANRVITVSNYLQDSLINLTKTPQDKVSVIYHGIEVNKFASTDRRHTEVLLNKYQLTTPFVLFVGERRPHKNLVNLIEAFSIFREMAGEGYSLVVIGNRYKNYLEPEERAKDLGLSSQIHFLNHLGDDELIPLYHLSESLIVPSIYEGFGIPVLEAMASGTPVIASNCTALPEVVGDAGILVSPDNPREIAKAMSKVVTDGELREEMIARGKSRAQQFSWEKCARKTLEVYYQALHER